jgi:hypothetical protein
MLILIPLAGVAAGAAGMYLFDPQQGRRRRAVLRDQVRSRARRLGDAASVAARDLRNRAQGTVIEVQRWSSMQEGEVPDRVLGARVRARIGRSVAHPRAIKVETSMGRVILRGAVLTREHPALLRAVRRVRGAQDVQDRLQVHDSPEHISSLQGTGPVRSGNARSWTPATRALSGGTGAALLLMGLRRRSVFGALASTAGALMLTRAVTDRPLSSLGAAAGRRARSGDAPDDRQRARPGSNGREANQQQSRRAVGAPAGWQSPAAPQTPGTTQVDDAGDDFPGYPTPS